MELEKIPEFILRIGNKRYRARFRGKTPAREIIFKLSVKTIISRLVEGQIVFSDETGRFYSNGVFYFPEPDMAVFYTKTGILSDRRDFERLRTGELVGFIRDMRDMESKMAVSAYDLSDNGAKIATYYPLVEKKHTYLIELDLDTRVFPFFNMQAGSVIFTSQCEVANMQAGKSDEIFYGLNFTKMSSESQRLIRMFLRDYGIVQDEERFDDSRGVNGSKKLSWVQEQNAIHDGYRPAGGDKSSFKGVIHTSDIKLVSGDKKTIPEPNLQFPSSRTFTEGKEDVHENDFFSQIAALLKRSGRVVFVSGAIFFAVCVFFLLYQAVADRKIMKKIVNAPGCFSLISEMEKQNKEIEPPVKTAPAIEDIFKSRKFEPPKFTPNVSPEAITSDNFADVVRENKFPLYSIDDTDYVSLRSILKLFMCEEELKKKNRVINIPYRNSKIVLRLETSEMIVAGEKVSMAYPVKKVSDEFLVSIDVMEEALILTQR
ncbi:MAG TPA: hypothetical protein PKN36_04185 [bacterium]|nr:hypothetical protein [bacterium]